MSIFDSTKAKPLAQRALSSRKLRQDMIASNLANIDTPFYKARDIDFEHALKAKAEQMYGTNEIKPKLRLALTNEKHLDPLKFDENSYGTIFLRDGHMARNDANTVDIDVETSQMSKNTIMVNALTKALKKQGQIFRSVIDAAGKV